MFHCGINNEAAGARNTAPLLTSTRRNRVMATGKIYRNRIYYKDPPELRIGNKIIIDQESGCWNWQGKLMWNGYGRFELDEIQEYAHRASYKIFNGPIQSDLYVLHHCDNRKCVNPKHLYCGTAQQNQDDCINRNRRPHGVKQWCDRLTPELVQYIRTSSKSDLEIGRELGVSDTTAYVVRIGRTWKRLPWPEGYGPRKKYAGRGQSTKVAEQK